MIRNEKKNHTLADTISNILNAAPSSVDPEDDENYTAKITEGSLKEKEEDETPLSHFRKQYINFLDDVDMKYSGKLGSRNALSSTDEEDGERDNDIEDENIHEHASSEISCESSEDNQKFSRSESEDEDEDTEEDSMIKIDVPETSNGNILKQTLERETNTQIQKGTCVRRQLSIWENLLEMRIQLQKCLITANKMPQAQVFQEIRKQAVKFHSKVNETRKNVETVLNKLLELQSLLLEQHPETRKLFVSSDSCINSENDEFDEEIESDIDVESRESEQTKEEVPRKRRKLSDYENEIKTKHNIYRSYRNSVIQKWNDKTRIAIGKKDNPLYSVLNQIEHILSDKPKLIRRTQTKRSNYDIVGKNLEEKSLETNQECDTEVFDDDDFYHQLLRELIEAKSSDLTDPLKLGRQWIQLQNMRSKMKRNIDTRATKGRKIRYTVHTKLVNFMAPIDDSPSTEEARNELYSSLFGKNCVYKS